MTCSSCSTAAPLADLNLPATPIATDILKSVFDAILQLPAIPIYILQPVFEAFIDNESNNNIDSIMPIINAIIEDETIVNIIEVSRGPIVKAFTSKGSVSLGQSTDLFVKFAYTLPFVVSGADSYITSLVSKDLILGFEPTYFQIPYIYSVSDNLVNGKYTSSSKVDGDLVITEYVVPYTGMLKEEYVLITTYYHKQTNILFYEIPRVLTYNSKDQASIAFTPNGKDFVGKIEIPSSFTSLVDENDVISYVLDISIAIPIETVPNVDVNGAALLPAADITVTDKGEQKINCCCEDDPTKKKIISIVKCPGKTPAECCKKFSPKCGVASECPPEPKIGCCCVDIMNPEEYIIKRIKECPGKTDLECCIASGCMGLATDDKCKAPGPKPDPKL